MIVVLPDVLDGLFTEASHWNKCTSRELLDAGSESLSLFSGVRGIVTVLVDTVSNRGMVVGVVDHYGAGVHCLEIKVVSSSHGNEVRDRIYRRVVKWSMTKQGIE